MSPFYCHYSYCNLKGNCSLITLITLGISYFFVFCDSRDYKHLKY